MEEDYVGDTELYQCMEDLKTMIRDEKFANHVKQEIYETLKCYVDGKHRLDPETVKCLFTGFVVRNLLMSNEVFPPTPEVD